MKVKPLNVEYNNNEKMSGVNRRTLIAAGIAIFSSGCIGQGVENEQNVENSTQTMNTEHNETETEIDRVYREIRDSDDPAAIAEEFGLEYEDGTVVAEIVITNNIPEDGFVEVHSEDDDSIIGMIDVESIDTIAEYDGVEEITYPNMAVQHRGGSDV